MENESTLTLENFATLFDTKEYVVRESEVIENNGIMIYELANKWSCTFIFGDIFLCPQCNVTHMLAEMISVNGLFVNALTNIMMIIKLPFKRMSWFEVNIFFNGTRNNDK